MGRPQVCDATTLSYRRSSPPTLSSKSHQSLIDPLIKVSEPRNPLRIQRLGGLGPIESSGDSCAAGAELTLSGGCTSLAGRPDSGDSSARAGEFVSKPPEMRLQ